MRFAFVLIPVLVLGLIAPSASAQPTAGARPADNLASEVPPEILAAEYPSPSAQTSLAITGAGLFAAWYGGAVGASLLFNDAPGARQLRIPIAGPWLALARAGCADDDLDCTDSDVVFRVLLTVIDGVGQLGALAFLGEAAFLPTAKGDQLRLKSSPGSVRAVPFVAGKSGVGLGVLGTF